MKLAAFRGRRKLPQLAQKTAKIWSIDLVYYRLGATGGSQFWTSLKLLYLKLHGDFLGRLAEWNASLRTDRSFLFCRRAECEVSFPLGRNAKVCSECYCYVCDKLVAQVRRDLEDRRQSCGKFVLLESVSLHMTWEPQWLKHPRVRDQVVLQFGGHV